MHAKITNGAVSAFPYSIFQLRADNPQVSFPADPPESTFEEFGVFPCLQTTRPKINYTQNVTEAFEQVAGAWTQTWVVTDASADEIEQRTQAQASSVRKDRNERLAASDWTQVIDAPVDQDAWAAYRQELRDIPSQVGFPWDVIWPTEPGV